MSSSSESEEWQQCRQVKRKHKTIPLQQKIKPKHKEIVINLSHTRYEVVREVAEELGWRVQKLKKKQDWDVLWVDQIVQPDLLIKMHFFQKVSHFPGVQVLARKNLLGQAFMHMSQVYPSHYNFFPRTWILPNEYPQFRDHVQKSRHHCYIVKPEADCQGRGIFLTFKTQDIENGKHYVIQEYVQRPFLIDKLKFDFRVYVLLCGTNPMRLYLYEEGLARFATEPYESPNKINVRRRFMHLTNYAVNKKNPNFVFNSTASNMSTGHKRSLTSVYKQIQAMGLNVSLLKERVNDVVTKTIILGQPLLSHQYKFCQPHDEYRNMCFHILGLDILIDECLLPVVLQVNHTPSFATETPLDRKIKFDLIKDTLLLMNINSQTKKQLVKKTNAYQRQHILNGKQLLETEAQREKVKAAQNDRDSYEDEHLGKYHRIYPIRDQQKMQQYDQFLRTADKYYFSQNNIIRGQIQTEKEKQGSKSPVKLMERKTRTISKQSSSNSIAKTNEKRTNNSTQFFRKSNNFMGNRKIKNSTRSYFPFTQSKHQDNLQKKPHRVLNSIDKYNLEKSQVGQGSIMLSQKGQNSISASWQGQVIGSNEKQKREEIRSPIKSQMTDMQRNHYINLRRKKAIKTGRQQTLNRDQRETIAFGTYLTPKLVLFDSYNQQQYKYLEKFERIGMKTNKKGVTWALGRKYHD